MQHIPDLSRLLASLCYLLRTYERSGVLSDDDSSTLARNDAKRFRTRCGPDRDDILIVSRGATIGRSCVVKSGQMFCLMGRVILDQSAMKALQRHVF